MTDNADQPAQVSDAPDVGYALSVAVSGCAEEPAHVIHWCAVMDVAFADGTRELAMITAANQPEWMNAAMLDWMQGEAAAHEKYADEDDGEEDSSAEA